METIWKYELSVTDEQIIEMPSGAEILAVQCQNNKPCLWAKVWSDSTKVNRSFQTFGTGHPIPIIRYRRIYIGTYQLNEGLVFHVFELKQH